MLLGCVNGTVNELSTNAETRNRWRTAVRRVAQNNLMAVGSLGAARKMTNPQFAAWRRKIIRWIAGAQWRKGTSDMWESHMVSLTETELSSMPVQPRTPHAGGNAQDYKASKRQRLTQAQQASDLAERAQAAGRRTEKGWAAPELADTPLGVWYAGEWKVWAKEMDELSSVAERIAVGARVTEEGRTKTMGRLKAKTHATEKLVGVQRSALARRVGVEALWARWLAGNGWADEVELQRTSGQHRIDAAELRRYSGMPSDTRSWARNWPSSPVGIAISPASLMFAERTGSP